MIYGYTLKHYTRALRPPYLCPCWQMAWVFFISFFGFDCTMCFYRQLGIGRHGLSFHICGGLPALSPLYINVVVGVEGWTSCSDSLPTCLGPFTWVDVGGCPFIPGVRLRQPRSCPIGCLGPHDPHHFWHLLRGTFNNHLGFEMVVPIWWFRV